jgi:ELWxxDGT repeat protein
VQDISSGVNQSSPYGFTALGDWLYFNASDGTHGTELWRTNATGTQRVADIRPGSEGSSPSNFTAFGGYLYFSASDGTYGTELWRTNGTTTTLVQDINTGTSGADGSDPSYFTALGDWLYFNASDGTHGYELWRTNGTTTTLISDINPGPNNSYPYGPIRLGNYIYFTASQRVDGKLWRVSAAGTIESAAPAGTNVFFGCMCEHPILTLNGRLFATMTSDETGFEFAYLDEATFGLPLTNRDGSGWSTALVLLAAVTAAAGVGLRMREAKRA